MVETTQVEKVKAAVLRFVGWLDVTERPLTTTKLFASRSGTAAQKLGLHKTCARNTGGCPDDSLPRRWYPQPQTFLKPQRFPIADAHYAWALLFSRRHWVRSNITSERFTSWKFEGKRDTKVGLILPGDPFNWETRHGTFQAETPCHH